MNCTLFTTSGGLALAFGTAIVLAGASRPSPAPAPSPATSSGGEVPLDIARIYFEFNSSANDLGVHVFLDGEDWKKLEIEDPDAELLFRVSGLGPYKALGMTELFFEGAEPSLDEVPLEELLDMFPEGDYEFSGLTVDGEEIEGVGTLSHAIPAGPKVFADVGPSNFLRISWSAVSRGPTGFPDLPIHVTGYQVIVGSFQVTVPASVLSVTVPPEFVGSLDAGLQPFEVLAIEASGNQSITEGTFLL